MEALRFVVAGGLNTLLTYAIYLACLQIVAYQAAYTVSYLAGIVIAFFFYSRYVFRTEATVGKALQFPAVYVVQYLLGLGMLYLVVTWLGIPAWLGPVFVIAVTLPATYLFSRVILVRGLSLGRLFPKPPVT